MKTLLPLLAILCSLTACTTQPSNGGQHKPATHAYTPAPDSPERKFILSAVHTAMHKQDPKQVVLVVKYLKVHDGWAWIQVDPQSPNGTQHYESQSGLLHKNANSTWTLVEWMPAEEGTNYPLYFKKLKAKYPEAPADIFPQ